MRAISEFVLAKDEMIFSFSVNILYVEPWDHDNTPVDQISLRLETSKISDHCA